MKNTGKTIMTAAIIAAIAAAALILVVKVIAPVCTGMLELASGKQLPMKCHYTSIALVFFGAIMLVNALTCLMTGQSMSAGIMAIVLAAACFIILDGKFGIGICVSIEMACHTTAPYVKVCAAVEAIAGIIMCACGRKK